MNKFWWIVVVIGVVIVGGYFWLSARDTVEVAVVHPGVGSIRAYVEEQATTELPTDYLISMPIDGWLEPISLREGDAVEEGQVVASLETDDMKDRVVQAEQRIAALKVQIDKAKDNRIEENAKIEMDATVKAIDETVKAAEARLEAARAVMEFQQEEVKRLTQAVEGGAVTDQELRRAELELRKARSDYQGDNLQLSALKTLDAVSYIGPKYVTDYIARKSFTLEERQKDLVEANTQRDIEQRNLDRAQIKSPVSGVVLERHQTQRRFLAAGTPLLTLGRLDDMEVIAEVLTERAVGISPGDPVEVFGQALPDRSVTGHVTRVYPAGFKKISSLGVEQQRVKVAVKFDDRPEQLGVGFRVYVRIIYEQADDAVTIPRSCLFRDSAGQWQVLTVDGDKLAVRTVKTGLINDDHVQVTDGLSKQDLVVTQPSRELTPGLSVKAVQQ